MDYTEKTDLLKALLAARQGFDKIAKDGKGQYGKYATLGSVLRAVEPALTANGLMILQPPDIHEQAGVPCICTILVHETGQAIESWYPIKPDTSGSKNELQAEGSGISYQRRYALCSLLGIAWGDDDDGQRGHSGGKGKSSGGKQQPKSDTQGKEKPNTGDKPPTKLKELQDATAELQKTVLIKTGLTLKELLEQAGATDIDKSDIEQVRKYKAKLEVLNEQE